MKRPGHQAAGGSPGGRALPLGIFALALAARLPYLAALRRTPLLEHPLLDPRFYDLWAQRLAGGDWLGREVFYANPLYPYYLGALYATIGRHLAAVHLVQHLLGSLGAALLALAGARLYGRAAGLLAGLGAALYGPFVFHEGSLMIESLAPFLGILALFLVVRAGEKRTLPAWSVAGLAAGVFVLARPNATPLAGAAWALATTRRGSAPAVFLAAAALAIAPVTARNWAVSHTFVPITAHGGEAFYVGNHPGADGYGTQPEWVDSGPATEHESYRRRASAILGRELTLAESSAYWQDLALRFAREHPGSWLRLLLRKLYLYLQAYERGDNTSFYFMRGEVPYLRLLPVGFGVVAPLALAGVWLTRRTWARTAIVPLFALAYASGVVLTFVLSRYRLPGVPPLILLAGAAGAWGWEAWRAGERQRVARAAVAAAVLALAVNLRTPLVIPDDPGTIHNNYGLVLEESGKIDEAAQHFAAAARLEPGKPLYHYNLARAERRRGRVDVARQELAAAIQLDPAYSDAHAELGFLLEAAGETAAALAEYRRAVELEPTLAGPAAGAAVKLAALLVQAGRPCEALPLLVRARERAPGPSALARLDAAVAELERTCGGGGEVTPPPP